MEKQKFVRADCSWQSNIEEKDLNDTVTARIKETDKSHNSNIDFDQLVQYETSVNFIGNPSNNIPEITLSVNKQWSNLRIDALTIVCSVNSIEAFAEDTMYLETRFGVPLYEDKDFPIFGSHIKFVKPMKKCQLRLLINKMKSDLWIFSIQVFLNNVEPSTSIIDFKNVERLLENVKISENAKKYMDLVKNVKIEKLNMPQKQEVVEDSIDMKEIKHYIDTKFHELIIHLDHYEDRLNRKLDIMLESITGLPSKP